jgi:hypothetical protein
MIASVYIVEHPGNGNGNGDGNGGGSQREDVTCALALPGLKIPVEEPGKPPPADTSTVYACAVPSQTGVVDPNPLELLDWTTWPLSDTLSPRLQLIDPVR